MPLSNIKNIFDTHAHYDDEHFQSDFETVIDYIFDNGVSNVLNVGCDIESSKKSISYSKTYPAFYAGVGIHPENCEKVPTDWLNQIEALSENEKVIAIGEIGLDYHYPEISKEIQLSVFEQQLVLANEKKLPVVIHCRDATNDMMQLLKKHTPRGVVHCFSGSKETAKDILALGMYIGFTGVVTFKNIRKPIEALEAIPLHRILLETDCPYMAPVPFRGKRTTSDMIVKTAEKIAEIKGITTQELIDITNKNARTLFKI